MKRGKEASNDYFISWLVCKSRSSFGSFGSNRLGFRTRFLFDTIEIKEFLQGKTVLITGGGGSIGSELSRQIACHNPKLLIVLDIYENNAYSIQQELLNNFPDLNLIVLIASVRNSARIDSIFETKSNKTIFLKVN